MIDIGIEDTGNGWDFRVEGGDLVIVDDRNGDDRVTVGQSVTYAMMVWRGEAVTNLVEGVPYLDTVFGEPVAGVSALLTQYALDADGVAEFLEPPEYVLDGDTLSQSFSLLTALGLELRLALEVQS